MHDLGIRAYHITHDERFWIVVTIAILAAMIAFAAWVGFKSSGIIEPPEMRPYFPYF